MTFVKPGNLKKQINEALIVCSTPPVHLIINKTDKRHQQILIYKKRYRRTYFSLASTIGQREMKETAKVEGAKRLNVGKSTERGRE